MAARSAIEMKQTFKTWAYFILGMFWCYKNGTRLSPADSALALGCTLAALLVSSLIVYAWKGRAQARDWESIARAFFWITLCLLVVSLIYHPSKVP